MCNTTNDATQYVNIADVPPHETYFVEVVMKHFLSKHGSKTGHWIQQIQYAIVVSMGFNPQDTI